MNSLYTSNETYSGVTPSLDIPNASGVPITSGLNKVSRVSNALKQIGDAFTKTVGKIYLAKKQQQAEEDYLKYKSDIIKSSVDLNNASDNTEISPNKLLHINDVNDLTPEEQKKLLKTHEVHAGNFLYEKYFNKLNAFKENVYSKYPKKIADKLYTQALRDTYNMYNKEYSVLTSDIKAEEEKIKALNTTTDLAMYFNDTLSKINDPQEKELAVKDLYNQIKEAAETGKPLKINGKEVYINSAVLGVTNKLLAGYQKKAVNQQEVKKVLEVQNNIDNMIQEGLNKNEGNIFGQMSSIVAIKSKIPELTKDLPADQKLRINQYVDKVYGKIKSVYNKKLLTDKGDSLAKYFVAHNGDIDDVLIEDVKANSISLNAFIDRASGEFTHQLLSSDSPKEILEQSMNFKQNLKAKFYDIPNINTITDKIDELTKRIINQKNNQLLSSINTLRNTGNISDLDTALDKATNSLMLEDKEKQKALIQQLRQQRHTLVLLDSAIKTDPANGYDPEVVSLISKQIEGKTPAYLSNVARKMAVNNIRRMQELLQKGDYEKLNRVLENSSFLQKYYRNVINSLDFSEKVKIGATLGQLERLHPNLVTNTTLLMKHSDIVKYDAYATLAKLDAENGSVPNWNKIKEKVDKAYSENNKEKQEFMLELEDKYGPVIDKAEAISLYVAHKAGIDIDGYFHENIYKDGGVYVRNTLSNKVNGIAVSNTLDKIKEDLGDNFKGAIVTTNKQGEPIIVPLDAWGNPKLNYDGKILNYKIMVGE